MEYLSDEIKRKIESAVEQKFETVLVDRIDTFINFFNILSELREAFPDYDESMMILHTENAKKICDSINIQVDNHYQRNKFSSLENLFPGLTEEMESLLSPLEQLIKVEQHESRFKILEGDNNYIQILKRIKIVAFKSHRSILKFINPGLKKFKRQPIKLKYWDQKIPLKNIGYYFLRNKLIKNLSLIYHDVFKMLSKKSVSFWKYDERYDEEYVLNFIKGRSSELFVNPTDNPDTIIAELDLLKEELKRKALSAIKQSIREFHSACDKAGTVELSKSRFKNKRITKNLKEAKSDFNKSISEWDNTLYALGEDWKLNYDLQSTRYSVLEVYFKFDKSLSIKNKIQIYPQFNEISRALHSVSEQLVQSTSSPQDLERLIAYSRENLQKVLLSSLLPNLVNSISDLRLPEMIEEASQEVKNQLASIKETRVFVKSNSYSRRIKLSEMDKIYPREFVTFNVLPKFSESLEKIRKKSSIELKNIQSELIHLGNMADFGLESAITAAKNEKLSESEIKEVAFEGVRLSMDRHEQLLISFNKVCKNVLDYLKSAISGYNQEMYALTLSSKVNEIKIQIKKAKAKVKAQETRESFYPIFKNIIQADDENADSSLNENKSNADTKKPSILAESENSITTEIFNFLSRTNSSIEKLPYSYRRLFQLSPLENDRLYINREFEANQMQQAFANWLNGNYSPVIISAEGGYGITSFLNVHLKQIETKYNIKRLSIKHSVFNLEELHRILGEMFVPEKFSRFEDLVDYLNIEDNRQVIVIENLQYLYLRDIKGFDCLKVLTEIISKTSKNIFWITSITLYANRFLNKAIRLNDIFGYHIFLKEFNSDQIANLVKIRNAISGYKLEYIPEKKTLRKKEFNKLSYEQKQDYLEKEYFDSLNKFTQSNVSLVLLYWLASIREIQERKVFINADIEISDTILNALSQDKIFILHSLVLHGGLHIPDIARTVNFSLEEANQLTQILYDEGVLIKNEELYFINPLLYRQSVMILKINNLI